MARIGACAEVHQVIARNARLLVRHVRRLFEAAAIGEEGVEHRLHRCVSACVSVSILAVVSCFRSSRAEPDRTAVVSRFRAFVKEGLKRCVLAPWVAQLCSRQSGARCRAVRNGSAAARKAGESGRCCSEEAEQRSV